MFGQQQFARLKFAQAPTTVDGPGPALPPSWDVICRADDNWTEEEKAASSINKCNKDL